MWTANVQNRLRISDAQSVQVNRIPLLRVVLTTSIRRGRDYQIVQFNFGVRNLHKLLTFFLTTNFKMILANNTYSSHLDTCYKLNKISKRPYKPLQQRKLNSVY